MTLRGAGEEVCRCNTILHDEIERIERARASGPFQMIDREIRLAKKNHITKSPTRRQAGIEHEERSIKAAP